MNLSKLIRENEVRKEENLTEELSLRDSLEQNLTTASDVSIVVSFPQQSTRVPSFTNNHDPDKSDGKVDQTDIAQLVQGMMLAINIPKPDLLSFSGDPADYSGFIKNFDVNISSKVSEERVKLMYLVEFCKGKARYSIENCVLMVESINWPEKFFVISLVSHTL